MQASDKHSGGVTGVKKFGPDRSVSPPMTPVPPGSCDSHCHIFGPPDLFPFAEDRTFTPPAAGYDDFKRMHDILGLDRAVIVQSSCHGEDHRVVVDAIQKGEGRYRGVALLRSADEKKVAYLDEHGFCGVRFHFARHLGKEMTEQEMTNISALVQEHGWHVAIHAMDNRLLAIRDRIKKVQNKVVIDHMARVDASEGAGGQVFVALRGLLDTGRVWVKISGIDRISREAPPFADGVKLARLLLKQYPERVVWGSDWPHPNVEGYVPNDTDMLNLLNEKLLDESTRRQVLVDTPARLFGFQ
ncbi:2-pyrone-4,6-dicarboxylate lactonase OS=Castellaniella defragrans OX=75697 GN=HNR28_001886 PE=4 SV=1 [Castellaniella defragrans]